MSFVLIKGFGYRSEWALLIFAYQVRCTKWGVALFAPWRLAAAARSCAVSKLPGVLQRCHTGLCYCYFISSALL